jgi:hypothetical protein
MGVIEMFDIALAIITAASIAYAFYLRLVIRRNESEISALLRSLFDLQQSLRETSRKYDIQLSNNGTNVNELLRLKDEITKLESAHEKEVGELCVEKQKIIDGYELKIADLLESDDGFEGFSRMIADLKGSGGETMIQERAILYKYEHLLYLFPELASYVDNYNPFCDLAFRKKYLGQSLSMEEEQESLDAYIRNEKKSKLAYGIAYEMFIGYLLRDDNWEVIQYGAEMGVHDLGRDIVARKQHEDGSATVYIIQCKNWAEWKLIPERYICQLYGTTEVYKRENTGRSIQVRALFVSSCQLDSTAILFCNKLGVEYRVMPFEEFPRIKCNVSKEGEKIYYLPFDRQYNTVKIKLKGEMYAKTVKEARDAGFRRAYSKPR